jgi:glycosyltransferase involved in cell wall biosynthesis
MEYIPAISVITACYNHGRYIAEMIQSVLDQTFQDFEIIIVNDGSTDNTQDVLDSVSDSRITIVHRTNQGPAAARNTAIGIAKAELLFNLDADDKIAPDLLGKLHSAIQDNPDAGIVYSDVEIFGDRSGRFDFGRYSTAAMLNENRISSIALFRKTDWANVGGYSTDLMYGLEDWDFWLSIIGLGRKVIKIEDSVVYYRTYKRLEDSRSGRRRFDRMKANWSRVQIFKRHQRLYSSYPDAYAKMSALERKMSTESSVTKVIKNSFYWLTRSTRYRLEAKGIKLPHV